MKFEFGNRRHGRSLEMKKKIEEAKKNGVKVKEVSLKDLKNNQKEIKQREKDEELKRLFFYYITGSHLEDRSIDFYKRYARFRSYFHGGLSSGRKNTIDFYGSVNKDEIDKILRNRRKRMEYMVIDEKLPDTKTLKKLMKDFKPSGKVTRDFFGNKIYNKDKK